MVAPEREVGVVGQGANSASPALLVYCPASEFANGDGTMKDLKEAYKNLGEVAKYVY